MKPPEEPPPEPRETLPEVRPRGLDKVREKTPIYLDPRQILVLTFWGLVALGLAFGAGWWTRGARQEVPPSPDGALAENGPCPAPPQVSEPPPNPPGVPPARIARSQVLPSPPEVVAREAESLPERWTRRLPDEAPPPPPPTSATASLPSAPPPPDSPGPAASEPVPPGNHGYSPVSEGIVGTPLATTPEEKRPGSGTAGHQPSGRQDASGDRPAVRTETDRARAPAPARPRWSVQVRAYRDPKLAEEYATTLKGRGYHARVIPFQDAGGETWYRIHVGRFATAADAQRFAGVFNRREGEKAIAVEGP